MKIKKIELTLTDGENREEIITFENLEDKCALVWGQTGVDFYLKSIRDLSQAEIAERELLIEKIANDCREKDYPVLFIKGNDCKPN